MIRETMRALVLHNYDRDFTPHLKVEECPTPKPSNGEVLIKVAASPVNPSDIMFMQGVYGVKKQTPTIPGFEGAGTVVAAGGGVLPAIWQGRRVAFVTQASESGTWAQYTVAAAQTCFPVGDSLPDEQAATALVNPLTAIALMERARELKARAVVSTAAASQVGRMLLRLGNQRAIPVIHIVRRDEQVDLLRGMGGRHILNSNDAGFESRLRDWCHRLKATVLLDAVGGDLTGRILGAMPRGSTAVIYGALAMGAVTVSPADFIFRDKRVEGFWLAAPQKNLSLPSLARVLMAGRGVLNGDSVTFSDIRSAYTLDEAIEGIQAYKANMSGGKVLITPNAGA